MNRVLLSLVITSLLAVGATAGLVINDPNGAKELAGYGSPASFQKDKEETPKETKGTKKAPAKGKEAAEPADGSERRPSTDRKPPRKGTASTSSDEASGIEITRKARPTGPLTEAITSAAPAPELYPFAIIRRSYPDQNSITVELAISNRSGELWKTAYIAIRSSGYKTAQQFTIEDWRPDETIGFDYNFPKHELKDRIRDLRVVSVSGELRESALGRRQSESRRKALSAVTQDVSRVRRDGDHLKANGLLGLFGQKAQPFTGIDVEQVSGQGDSVAASFTVNIDPELRIPAEPSIKLRDTTTDRAQAAKLLTAVQADGFAVQGALDQLVTALQSGPYKKAMEAKGKEALANLKEKQAKFNASGIALATLLQKSTDPEVKRANAVLVDYSQKIRGQLDSVEAAIKMADPSFMFWGLKYKNAGLDRWPLSMLYPRSTRR